MIKSLEGGRGVAALIVALFHLSFGEGEAPLIPHGYLFVDLFFVLSGFVICSAYENRLQTLADGRAFLIRRFGRLFPLLLFSTLVYVLAANAIVFAKHLAVAYGHAGALHNPKALDYLIPQPLEVLSTLTMTHGLHVFDDLILNTPSWSISTEFYTYLLFGGVCLVMTGRLRLFVFALLCAIGLAASIAASILKHDCLQAGGCLSLTYDFGFPRTICSFFLGALASRIARRPDFSPGGLQAVSSAALALALTLVGPLPGTAFAFPFLFALLIVSVSSDQGWLAALLKSRPCQLLGERSYSIYLMHMPLVLFFENIARRVDGILAGALVLLAYVGVLFIVSGLTWRYIEEPFRNRFNRLATGRVAAPMHSAQS